MRVLVPALLLGAAAGADAQQAEPWCFTGFHPGEVEGTIPFPEGDLFCPLIADPKAERSFISYLRGEFPSVADDGDLNIGSVGIGDAFHFVRFAWGDAGDGLQVGLVGSVFAQFNLDAPSFDLINADYLVGIPLTLRSGGFSARARVYHQSSHLGDELLLGSELERENLSFEALDLLLSHEVGSFRAYGGGELLFNREPETLGATLAHGGLEVRVGDLRGARLVAALDVKTGEEQEWKPGLSARAGVEFAHWRDETHPPRLWSILAELYDGPSPYGQFFQDDVRYLGLGVHLPL